MFNYDHVEVSRRLKPSKDHLNFTIHRLKKKKKIGSTHGYTNLKKICQYWWHVHYGCLFTNFVYILRHSNFKQMYVCMYAGSPCIRYVCRIAIRFTTIHGFEENMLAIILPGILQSWSSSQIHTLELLCQANLSERTPTKVPFKVTVEKAGWLMTYTLHFFTPAIAVDKSFLFFFLPSIISSSSSPSGCGIVKK